ncbi:TIM-barrel domain-containing protein [Spirillospora sp. CA-294931]|uniref:TIM-barrel domain-containing protein n=1 Tax=Spirillospora sp. CA-294931 TaxID=3240042 RepID=UPI003D930165
MRRFAHPLAVGLLLTGLAVPFTAPAAQADGDTLGEITGVKDEGNGTFTLDAGKAKVRLVFLRDDAFRLWLAPDGNFTDPANTPPGKPGDPSANIVAKKDYTPPPVKLDGAGDRYEFSTGKVSVKVTKKTPLFSAHRADGSLVFDEAKPLTWSSTGTTQTLRRGEREQFFGGGMQLGRLNHRDQTIGIFPDGVWDKEGGHPNPAPFYQTTAGYGVFRNTFSKGSYSFKDPVATTQQEQRFDAYYFVAPKASDLKTPIDRYTELTGRPFMPPIYGMEMGDADCYNTSSPTSQHKPTPGKMRTPDAIKVAQAYRDNDMPNGWMLVNDGYGCGYVELPETGAGLRERGQQMGLWTENGLPNQEAEVGKAGVRVRKLDVAWIGAGYRKALSGCEEAHGGIEKYSSARGFAWTVAGWSGTQRCAVQWTGDHSGSLDSIKWQIPAIAGSGLSGIAYSTGDIDGIFGGSDESYVRDLQWKVFNPVLMSMSGWASKDKQPWRRGEPSTSINRNYLKLRERLLPYLYTYAAEAHRTGAPINRPLVMEYPTDARTWEEGAKDEFLAGRDFLVAPVYTSGETRDGIYLPEGRWIDYWTGQVHDGGRTLNGYHAPLDRLPLFVRAGAVVPMNKAGINNAHEQKPGDPITLDVYPSGRSSFDLYADDGVTRGFQQGAYGRQHFEVDAPKQGGGQVKVEIGKLTGDYEGKPTARPYQLTVHTGTKPSTVAIDGKEITGWTYDKGVVTVTTPQVPVGESRTVTLNGTSAVGGRTPSDQYASTSVVTPPFVLPGTSEDVKVSFTNRTGRTLNGVKLGLALPQGWPAAQGTTLAKVRSGETASGTVKVTVPADAKPGQATLHATADYEAHGPQRASSAASVKVAYASLASAFDNTGVSDNADTKAGNLDGSGSSFSKQALAAAGVTPGGEVKADGTTYTWPVSASGGKPDNATGRDQVVAVSGKGARLGLLGTATAGGGAGGTVTVYYADGTTGTGKVTFPNWCCTATGDAKIAFSVKGKNTADGANQYPTVDYRVYSGAIALDPGKEVRAVRLPSSSPLHVFAAAVS